MQQRKWLTSIVSRNYSLLALSNFTLNHRTILGHIETCKWDRRCTRLSSISHIGCNGSNYYTIVLFLFANLSNWAEWPSFFTHKHWGIYAISSKVYHISHSTPALASGSCLRLRLVPTSPCNIFDIATVAERQCNIARIMLRFAKHYTDIPRVYSTFIYSF